MRRRGCARCAHGRGRHRRELGAGSDSTSCHRRSEVRSEVGSVCSKALASTGSPHTISPSSASSASSPTRSGAPCAPGAWQRESRSSRVCVTPDRPLGSQFAANELLTKLWRMATDAAYAVDAGAPDAVTREHPSDCGTPRRLAHPVLGPGVRKDVGVRVSPLAQGLWDGWKSSGLSKDLSSTCVILEPGPQVPLG